MIIVISMEKISKINSQIKAQSFFSIPNQQHPDDVVIVSCKRTP